MRTVIYRRLASPLAPDGRPKSTIIDLKKQVAQTFSSIMCQVRQLANSYGRQRFMPTFFGAGYRTDSKRSLAFKYVIDDD